MTGEVEEGISTVQLGRSFCKRSFFRSGRFTRIRASPVLRRRAQVQRSSCNFFRVYVCSLHSGPGTEVLKLKSQTSCVMDFSWDHSYSFFQVGPLRIIIGLSTVEAGIQKYLHPLGTQAVSHHYPPFPLMDPQLGRSRARTGNDYLERS